VVRRQTPLPPGKRGPVASHHLGGFRGREQSLQRFPGKRRLPHLVHLREEILAVGQNVVELVNAGVAGKLLSRMNHPRIYARIYQKCVRMIRWNAVSTAVSTNTQPSGPDLAALMQRYSAAGYSAREC